jgi:nucleoside-diphosphate-sugar epimerase
MTKSDFSEPLNLGSDEMVSMNEMADMILGFSDKKLPIKHIPGPEGVRGRNSDNTLIKEKLGWAPVRLPSPTPSGGGQQPDGPRRALPQRLRGWG